MKRHTTLEVNLREEPGIYRITSSSSTVYYVEVGDGYARMLRARGGGATSTGWSDDSWVRLVSLTSGPPLERDGRELARSEIDTDDVAEWTLRVGSRHTYTWETFTEYPYWIQRVCEGIERLDQMPPVGERTIDERVPRDDL